MKIHRIWWEDIVDYGIPSWLGAKIVHIFKLCLYSRVGWVTLCANKFYIKYS